MKRSKRSYDTNIIYLALYDKEALQQLKKIIPASTISTWLKNGSAHYYGKQFAGYNHSAALEVSKELAQSERLIQLAKGMCHLYSGYKAIASKLPNLKKVCSDNKKIIVDTFHAAALYLPKNKIYKALGVSYDFIHYKEVKKCAASILNKCFKKHPHQLSNIDVKTIRDYCLHPIYKHWQGISIYWQMVKDKKLFCSKTTFYRYVHKLGIVLSRKRNNWKNYVPIIASKPFEILHMDVTPIVLNNLKGYLYLIVDNFSRSILAHEFSKTIKSFTSTKNLIQVCRKHNLSVNPYVTLITDGGSENKGYVNRFVNLPCVNIIKKIAQSDITSSNSLIESVIKQLKKYHIKIDANDDFDKVAIAIDIGIREYENKPLDVHQGYSPTEARLLTHCFQNKETFFSTEEIKTMRENRIKTNKINACGTCR